MAQLATIVAYVKGPVIQSKGFFRKTITSVYLVSPQLYLRENAVPIINYGVRRYSFGSSEVPNRVSFESFIREEIKTELGRSDIRASENSPIIPPECIGIEIKFED